jgi:hypothetical protein
MMSIHTSLILLVWTVKGDENQWAKLQSHQDNEISHICHLRQWAETILHPLNFVTGPTDHRTVPHNLP